MHNIGGKGRNVSRYYFGVSRLDKILCPVCGEPYGPFHDGAKCAETWIRQCDEEARKSKDGAKP